MPFLSSHAKVIGFNQFLNNMQNYGVDDCTLIDAGVPADVYGNKVVYPGTVIAKITGSTFPTYGKCVVRVRPFHIAHANSGPSYGPGSDVAWGILRNIADLTYGDQIVAVVRWGHVREAFINDVGTVGTVLASTKTSLPHIEWE